MKQKQILIILGAFALVFLLFWFAVITLVIKKLSGLNKSNDPLVINVTLCDVDASNLCIITFGANDLNRMVIDFQLPAADYAPFYVKATNRETVSVYACETLESKSKSVSATATESALEQPTAEVKSALTHAQCTGVRTPLGETIDLEVYTTDGDRLIARGTFLVSAIALSTPIIKPPEETLTEAPLSTEAPLATQAPLSTDIPFATEAPLSTEAPLATEDPFATEAPFFTEEPAP
jgi:hypothetical protein